MLIHCVIFCKISELIQATIVMLILVENNPALLRTQSEDLLVKSEGVTTVETQVPAVYLKMTDNTRQKLANSFSEDVFQLLLT